MAYQITLFRFFYLLISSAGLILTACDKAHQSHTTFFKAEPSQTTQMLYYTGIIQPIPVAWITSPVEGIVKSVAFEYGDNVNKNQLLLTIESAKYEADYKTAVMQYVKTKNDWLNSQMAWHEANFLHQHRLISDDEYKAKENNFYSAKLALLQAKDSLASLLMQTNHDDKTIFNLTINDVAKLTQLFSETNTSPRLSLTAPQAGMILSVAKSSGENKTLMIGDTVKQGDILALIGDTQGFCIRIHVNELIVNKLHVGQAVMVSGFAFAEQLQGVITHVAQQAETVNGSPPEFAIEIAVNKLNQQQQKNIHIGMSATVTIPIMSTAIFMIPIVALIEKNAQTYVRIYNKEQQRTQLRAVETGTTSLTKVEIKSGIRKGENIVIPAIA